MNTAQRIAKHLLDIQAVTLSPKVPYTWASGIKSPIYCDNRITMGYPEIRKDIAQAFVQLIKAHYPEVDVIGGTATAGIPQACWVSDLLDLPMVYVRGKAKDHGKGNQIEGRLEKGQTIVLIEDLISTGGSVLEAVEACQEQGAIVLGVVAIFSYLLPKATQAFAAKAVELHTLSNYDVLLETAVASQKILASDLETLKEWKKDPAAWWKG